MPDISDYSRLRKRESIPPGHHLEHPAALEGCRPASQGSMLVLITVNTTVSRIDSPIVHCHSIFRSLADHRQNSKHFTRGDSRFRLRCTLRESPGPTPPTESERLGPAVLFPASLPQNAPSSSYRSRPNNRTRAATRVAPSTTRRHAHPGQRFDESRRTDSALGTGSHRSTPVAVLVVAPLKFATLNVRQAPHRQIAHRCRARHPF